MASGRLTPGPSQLTRGDINSFCYSRAVVVKGADVLRQVFKWTYQGSTQPVKDYFLSLGHSIREFRAKFNKLQRDQLDTGQVDDYDVLLLFVLLQEVCSLDWKTPIQFLEHMIYKLKTKRNNIAHSPILRTLADSDLRNLLTELEDLYSEILRQAGNRTGTPAHDVQDLIEEIRIHFQSVTAPVREPINPFQPSQLTQLLQEIQIFKNDLKNRLKMLCRAELSAIFPKLWDISLVQFLYPNYKMKPSVNFTNMIIQEEARNYNSSLQEEPSYVPIQDLLVKQQNGNLPDVIILAGDGGIGKTTLLKFMLEMWVTPLADIESPGNCYIKNLQNYMPLLYFQLRCSSITRWKDLLKNLLYQTYDEAGVSDEHFSDLVLDMDPLILLDGYDEAREESKQLVNTILGLPGKIRILITTRYSSLDELNTIVRAQPKSIMVIEIKGTKQIERSNFVQRTLSQIVDNENRRHEVAQRILHGLDLLDNDNADFDVPLIITMYVLREVEATTQSLVGNVYDDFTEMMMIKAKERLILNHVPTAVIRKMAEYLLFIQEISLRCLKISEFDLTPDTVQELINHSENLGLPHKEMLSTFFTSKKSVEGNEIIDTWCYPHKTFQEFWATGFLIDKLKEKIWRPFGQDQEVLGRPNVVFDVYAEDHEERNGLSNRESEEAKLFINLMCNAARQMREKSLDLLDDISEDIVKAIILCRKNDSLLSSDLTRLLEATVGNSSITNACKVSLQNRNRVTIINHNCRFPNGLMSLFSLIDNDKQYVVMKDQTLDLILLDIKNHRPNPETLPKLATTNVECINMKSPRPLTGRDDILWWCKVVERLAPRKPTRINVAIHLSSSGADGADEETAVRAMKDLGIKANRLLLVNKRALQATRKDIVEQLATDDLNVCNECRCMEYGWWYDST